MSFVDPVLVYNFSPTIPADTAEDDPYTTTLTIPPLEVVALYWQQPAGANGWVGWQITDSSGAVIVPTNGGWFVASDAEDTWPLYDAITSGAWGFAGWNTGTYDHTTYLRFLCQPLGSSQSLPDQYTVVSANG